MKKEAGKCFASQVRLKQEGKGLVLRLTGVTKVKDDFLDQVLRERLSKHLEEGSWQSKASKASQEQGLSQSLEAGDRVYQVVRVRKGGR